jgi:glutathione S-transferase
MHLYSAPISLFGKKAEIALAEKGLAFERTLVAFTQSEGYKPKHPAVLAANPKAQVPVLVDGELTLFDSTVIFEYLEDAYPQPPLYPAGAAAKARCRQLELIADEILLPPVRTLMHRSVPRDPARWETQEAEAAKGEATLRALFAELEQKLGAQNWFCGAFSVADIALFLMVFWSKRLKGPATEGRLGAWYERCLKRPSIVTVIEELLAADRKLSPALYA